MTNTGLRHFDNTVQTTIDWLKIIEEETHWDRQQAYLAAKSVLHTMRDRLPVTEAVNFAGQLPLLMKGVYFEGWQPENKPEKYDTDAFIGEVIQRVDQPSNPELAELGIKAVHTMLERKSGATEMETFLGNMPEDLQQYFKGIEGEE